MTRPNPTVDHNPNGWPRNDGRQPGIEECRSILARRARGLPPCDNTAVWRIQEHRGHLVTTSWYCDEDLPYDLLHTQPAQQTPGQ